MKPGYKTTEFWLSLAAILLGALITSGAIPADSVFDKLLGIAATVLGALGYTVSRAFVKNTAAKADALIATGAGADTPSNP